MHDTNITQYYNHRRKRISFSSHRQIPLTGLWISVSYAILEKNKGDLARMASISLNPRIKAMRCIKCGNIYLSVTISTAVPAVWKKEKTQISLSCTKRSFLRKRQNKTCALSTIPPLRKSSLPRRRKYPEFWNYPPCQRVGISKHLSKMNSKSHRFS